MGNRISIAFKNGSEESVTLFSHWGGLGFKKKAKEYLKELKDWLKDHKEANGSPLSRKEPNTVMFDFIRHIKSGPPTATRETGDYYLGKDQNDGDNSDNGHHIIDVNH